MQPIWSPELWAGCGRLLPTANQGTVLLPPLADLGCENIAGIHVVMHQCSHCLALNQPCSVWNLLAALLSQ